MKTRAGLTLLEVLAAVALLGLVFTALARSGSEGIASEGKSRRRFEASLLADATLAEIELGMVDGIVPPEGLTESEAGEFRVEVESQPWALPEELEEFVALQAGGGIAQVFAAADGQEAGMVREIAVRVYWDYGNLEMSVERITFGLDLSEILGETGGIPPIAGVER